MKIHMSSKPRLSEGNAEDRAAVEAANTDHEVPAAERGTGASIDREQIFEVLSNERRRLVLRYLRHHRGADAIGFRDLVDQVTAWEHDKSKENVCSKNRKRVYTALRQTHLPKLAQYSIIEFDQQRGVLRPKENVDEVLLYMRFTPEREIFWSQLYLLLAFLGGLFTLLVWLGIVSLWNVPQITVAVGIVVVFGVISLAQIYQHRRTVRSSEPEGN